MTEPNPSAQPARDDWIAVVARKRNDQKAAIELFEAANLHAETISDEICDLEYSALAERLSSGALSAEAVTIAYIRR